MDCLDNYCDVIAFDNGDTEEWYYNLLDNKYYYCDCETLFNLGIFESSTFDDIIEFKLIEDNGRLEKLEREIKLRNLLE